MHIILFVYKLYPYISANFNLLVEKELRSNFKKENISPITSSNSNEKKENSQISLIVTINGTVDNIVMSKSPNHSDETDAKSETVKNINAPISSTPENQPKNLEYKQNLKVRRVFSGIISDLSKTADDIDTKFLNKFHKKFEKSDTP